MSKEKTQTQEKPYSTEPIDIHKYARRIQYSKKHLLHCRDGNIGIQFLEKLKLFGLSDGRITVLSPIVFQCLGEYLSMNHKIYGKHIKQDWITVKIITGILMY